MFPTASKPPEVRQLEKLFQEKFIPWAQGNAPLLLFDAPPRSSFPAVFAQQSTLLHKTRPTQKYPHVYRWPKERLNAISVPVLGCIFEGEADYRVHAAAEGDAREWIIPIEEGTFFAIPAGTPFSDGSRIAWERAQPQNAFSRGILMHLRRDGVNCRTFTCDKGEIWLHPYVFLHQAELNLLGDKLIEEMRSLESAAHPVAALYWQLSLRLMLRALQQGEYSALRHAIDSPLDSPLFDEFSRLSAPAHSEAIIRAADEYIRLRLGDPELSCRQIARHLEISERQLSRVFQGSLQTTIYAYLQTKRGEKACALLQQNGIKISEIATYCGFKHASAFSAWFTRRFQHSPTEYRALQVRNL